MQKSGTDSIYYDYAEDYVDWADGGEEIKGYDGSRPQNEEYYFERGVTYRSFGNYLAGRLQKGDMIFSHKSNYVSPDSHSETVLLAHLNSTLYRYIINGLNPGLNFEVGDGKRLPIKEDVRCGSKLGDLVNEGIDRRLTLSKLKENSADFEPATFLETINESPVSQLLFVEEKLNSELMLLHGTVDDLIFDEYNISKETREDMYSNLPKKVSQYDLLINFGEELPEIDGVAVNSTNRSGNELSNILESLSNRREDAIRELAQDIEISPYSIAFARKKHDLYSCYQKKEAAGRIVSFLLGTIFGRWETQFNIPKANGEIIVFDSEDGPGVDDLVRSSLDVLFDDSYAIREALKDVFGKSVTTWLRESFFRHHHGKEYRRRGQRIPIYWQLASDDGTFSCYIYFHSMTADTLPKLRGQYVDMRIQVLQNRIRNVETKVNGADGDRERELRNELEKLQEQLDDVEDFGERLDALIDDGFEPDFEAGIWENIQKVDEYDLLQTELDKL